MENYILALTVIGLAALAMAWLPALMENRPISYAMIFVGLGFLLFKLTPGLPVPDPITQRTFTLRLTELGVITTLMGTGLKINREFGWRNWQVPFLLVGVAMLLCMGALGWLSWWALGFAPASALLLAAVLAPTDPVLAAEVQVGPPSAEKEDHVRFSLTSEAGMNDGLAFPFTWLAIVLAAANPTGWEWFWPWVGYHLVYKVVAGVGLGLLCGRFLSYLIFNLPQVSNFPKAKDGFVAISATLLVYGLTEIIHGYGFIAVFVAGLTIGNHEKPHKYHRELHDFTEQIERIFLVVLLLLFGGSLAQGLLNALTLAGVLVGVVFVFVIRPLAAYLTLIRQNITVREKVAISFFGIRGIGSFYYLAFALGQATFPEEKLLWAITGFVVLLSVVVHGILASPVMRYLDLRRHPHDLEVV